MILYINDINIVSSGSRLVYKLMRSILKYFVEKRFLI